MPRDPSRRDALRAMSRSAAALACVPLVGCTSEPPGPPLPRVPLADLVPGRRIIVTIGIEPIEVARTEEGIQARSLLCTHMGCRVSWHDDACRYVCACHEGTYDANGEPVAGPPLEPLRRAPFRIDRGDVVIGG